MDIPELIAAVGAQKTGALYQSKIQAVRLSDKDKEKGLLNIYMDFDLDNSLIRFTAFPCDAENDVKTFLYFGNNARAAKQYYVVREAASFINYWTGNSKGIMMNLLGILPDGKLKDLLGICQEQGLFDMKGLCLDKIEGKERCFGPNIEIDYKKKKITDHGKSIGMEVFLRTCLGIEGTEKLVLVIPRIISNGHICCISQTEEYLDLISSSLSKDTGKNQHAICHICNQLCDDIDTVGYTAGLSGHSLNKVFVSTTINYAPSFNKNNYYKNYALCRSCYEKLMAGETQVMKYYRIRVAGENCILLIAGLLEPLEQRAFPVIRDEIDIVFKSEKYAHVEKRFLRHTTSRYFQFHMVFYQSDGKSTKVRKTIESISNVRFNDILDTFEAVRLRFGEVLPYFSLNHIYHMIPVTTNKKSEQIDIVRVLDFYGSILSGECMDRDVVFSLAAETLEKGMRELRSEKLRNYGNLAQLKQLWGKSYGPDIYVANMVIRYMALLEVLQELHIIDGEVFGMAEEQDSINAPEYIQQAEKFMKGHSFSNVQKGLFYIGALTYQIGSAQSRQNHKTKPILDKISYSGMGRADILAFYEDLLDKVRQYKNARTCSWLLGKSEQIIKKIQLNIGQLDELDSISEPEGVFYLMSGYAFCVQNRPKKSEECNATLPEGDDEDDRSENE